MDPIGAFMFLGALSDASSVTNDRKLEGSEQNCVPQ
jgi:hypothetical protein